MLDLLKKCRYYKLYKSENRQKALRDRFNIVGQTPSDNETLENTFKWIKSSFEATKDGGSAAYYTIGHGWKASYPETTGYLIPTIYSYAKHINSAEWRQIAKKAANWLLNIQSAEGGWQGLQVGINCELRVFNTAMILDGLIAAYKEEKDVKYLEASKRAFRWLLSKIDDDGFMRRNNVTGGGAFDTLTIACMLLVVDYLNETEKKSSVTTLKKSLDAIAGLQEANGWFSRCNFSDSYPNTALLHHIGYTVDGFIRSSESLNDTKYYDIAKKTARKLLSKFEVELELPAYSNSDWSSYKDINNTRASLCLTGYSQIAIVFQRIYNISMDLRYLNAAYKINDIVSSIGNQEYSDNGLSYGLAGSYPVYGNYQPYKFVNWAVKYHADSVLMSLAHNNSSL